MLYVTHERSGIAIDSDVELHLFDPSSSPKGILRTITIGKSDGKKREWTKRQQDWIKASLKEELGKLIRTLDRSVGADEQPPSNT